MTLYNDDIAKIKEIARQIVKEEIEAMGKALKAEIDRLETEVKDVASRVIELERETKDLKAEINRAKEVKDQSASETAKTAKKGVFK